MRSDLIEIADLHEKYIVILRLEVVVCEGSWEKSRGFEGKCLINVEAEELILKIQALLF